MKLIKDPTEKTQHATSNFMEYPMRKSPTTDEQIIQCDSRYVEDRACPGGGKTHRLMSRIAYLLKTGCRPEDILVLSFSKTCVDEILDRLQHHEDIRGIPSPALASITEGDPIVTVKTVHSLAYQLVIRQSENLNVLTDSEAMKILHDAIGTVHRKTKSGELWKKNKYSPALRKRRQTEIQELLHEQPILLLMQYLLYAHTSELPKDVILDQGNFSLLARFSKILNPINREYQRKKAQKNKIDFGDMLHLATKAVLSGSFKKYRHVLIDEYQDCSAAQRSLIKALASTNNRTLMVFGDPHQAIYGFGGSGYAPLSSILDGVQTFTSRHTHRLTQSTADLASAIISESSEVHIVADRMGCKPHLFIDNSLNGQIDRIVSNVLELVNAGIPFNQIAILSRLKYLLEPIEMSLLAKGILTQRLGTSRNRINAFRVLRLVHLVEKYRRENRRLTPEVLYKKCKRWKLADLDFWSKAQTDINKIALCTDLEGRFILSNDLYLRSLGGMRRNLEMRTDLARWEPFCRNYSSAKEMMVAVRDLRDEAVVTGTIHAAKGREWDHVRLVGATDGLLPFYKAHNNPMMLSEERRLLYVAVSRARETVDLFHTSSIHPGSRKTFQQPCRFLCNEFVEKTLMIEPSILPSCQKSQPTHH